MNKKKKILIASLVVGALLLIALIVTLIVFGTSYTVTYDLDGGTMGVTSTRVWHGKNYNLPTPTKAGYAFGGWFYNGVYVSSTGIWQYKEDVTLKARWSLVDSLGFTYKKVENGYIIERYGGEAKDLILIPSQFNNAPIVGIDAGALKQLEEKIANMPNGYIKVLVPSSVATAEEVQNLSQKLMMNRYSSIDKNGMIYLEKENEIAVVGYYGEYSVNIVIPETYNGKPVTTIDSYAFYGTQFKITSTTSDFFRILIPLNVTQVNYGAFGRCDRVKTRLYRIKNERVSEVGTISSQFDWLEKASVADGNGNFVQVISTLAAALGWSLYDNADYYVRFDSAGGKIVIDKEIEDSGNIITIPVVVNDMTFKQNKEYTLPVPKRPGYTFAGWYYGDTVVAQNGSKWGFDKHIKLTAKWIQE